MSYDLAIICKRLQCLAALLCVPPLPTRGRVILPSSTWPHTQGRGTLWPTASGNGTLLSNAPGCGTSAPIATGCGTLAPTAPGRNTLVQTASRTCAASSLSAQATVPHRTVTQARRQQQLVALSRCRWCEVVSPPPRSASPSTTHFISTELFDLVGLSPSW